MSWQFGRARRLRAAVCSLAACALCASAPAHAGVTTSFRATTAVGATVLPRSAATGEWTLGTRTATLHVDIAVQPAPARTHVEATWVSPYARSRGRCFGRYDFYYLNHRLVLPTPHVADRVRYREQGGRWSRWYTEYDEDYKDTDPDMAVGSGMTDDCMFIFARVPRRPVQLEILHAGDYAGTHRITEDLTVRVP
jgi:hypothetical protein